MGEIPAVGTVLYGWKYDRKELVFGLAIQNWQPPIILPYNHKSGPDDASQPSPEYFILNKALIHLGNPESIRGSDKFRDTNFSNETYTKKYDDKFSKKFQLQLRHQFPDTTTHLLLIIIYNT